MKVRIILSILLLSFSMAHADNISDARTAELIETIAAEYYDAYLTQPNRAGDYQIGSSITDLFHKEGVVRLIISLPDGTQKILDFDERFSTAKPTKLEPTSNTTSRLSFDLNHSTVSVTSTTHLSKYTSKPYQVWTIDKP